VFASPRFRLLLALCVVAFGLVANAAYILAHDALDMPILSDYEEYYRAARRLVEKEPLYHAAHLVGSVEAACIDCYRYPPPLAQAMIPLALLPIAMAKVLWFMLMSAAAFASTWLATGIGGAARTIERGLWCAAATLLFFPVLDGNVAGNVSSLIALMATLVALGGVAAGFGAVVGALIKVVPGVLLPAAFVASRESRVSLIASSVVIGGISFALAPSSWLDYPAMFLNMTTGTTDYERNVALANAAAQIGLPGLIEQAFRIITVLIAIGGIVLSVWLARRPNGMPAAALAGSIAMLLVPATLWPHYLAVLLPFAAMAWPSAGTVVRVALFGTAGLLSVASTGNHYLAIHAAAMALVIVAGWALWPRARLNPH
jgi:hypothetical protein